MLSPLLVLLGVLYCGLSQSITTAGGFYIVRNADHFSEKTVANVLLSTFFD